MHASSVGRPLTEATTMETVGAHPKRSPRAPGGDPLWADRCATAVCAPAYGVFGCDINPYATALTRFRLAWRFDGQDARIASRAIDETGYVQPTRAALIAARGTNSIYHYNGIKVWHVRADGTVINVEA